MKNAFWDINQVILNLYMRGAFDLALLSSRVSQPNSFFITDGLAFLLYFWNINLAALLCTISSFLIFPGVWGSQTAHSYSIIGLKRDVKQCFFTGQGHPPNFTCMRLKVLFAIVATFCSSSNVLQCYAKVFLVLHHF